MQTWYSDFLSLSLITLTSYLQIISLLNVTLAYFQMWELHSNGTLENSYSGLCAVLNPVKGLFRLDQLHSPLFSSTYHFLIL